MGRRQGALVAVLSCVVFVILLSFPPEQFHEIRNKFLPQDEDNVSESYRVVECAGPGRSFPILQLCNTKRSCRNLVECPHGIDRARFDNCRAASARNTSTDARLNHIGVYKMKNGKVLCAHAKTNDIVSTAIMNSGKFEADEIAWLTRWASALRKDVQTAARLLLDRHGVEDSESVIANARWDDGVEMIDIGMNIGALSLPLWALGFAVYGVEGLIQNQQLLRMTQCLNSDPSLPPLEMVPTALTNRESLNASCVFVTDFNVGDGWVICGAIPAGFKFRANLTFRLLDDVFPEPKPCTSALYDAVAKRIEGLSPVASTSKKDYVFPSQRLNASSSNEELKRFLCNRQRFVKIDVESHEIHVFEGGTRFLRSPSAPVTILSEVWKELDSAKYAGMMRESGYVMYHPIFGWVRNDEEAAGFKKWNVGITNVFFVKIGSEVIIQADYAQKVNLTSFAKP